MDDHKDNNDLMRTTEAKTDVNTIIELTEKNTKHKQLSWYYSPAYLLCWVALFYAVVYPLSNYLPTGVKIAEETEKPGQFVAERAQRLLYEIDGMGPRVVGDVANEVTVVQFLLREIEEVRKVMREDLYEMEVDVQRVSGSYLISGWINMYQGVQNVLVKLSTKSSNSSSYLLLNSHYDTKPGATGAGDDAHMVVVMLEVLRQMVISEETFQHPIVFLFNGAEEQPLQAAHGFITQHKWSPNCRALVNLEGSGAGGREQLFQSGPNHPWLMRHYRKSAKHPFATTIAEEVFQGGFIPSQTDFKIFRDYGPVPGLDMAIVANGYVYHTKFDRYSAVSRDSLQNTGDNLLPLVRSLANAEEMNDTKAHSDGHCVFFDFLGLFLVYYRESTGIALNISFALGGILLVCLSIWRMSKVTGEKVGTFAGEFGIFFLLAIAGFILALGFPLLMSVFYDASDRTMTYFANTWLLLGIFVCPTVIGLVLPMTLYLTLKSKDSIPHSYRLQIAGHAYCVLLAVICILLTALSLRSAYVCMISLLFYVGALMVNLVSRLHDRGYFWVLTLAICQIMPFLYTSYVFSTLVTQVTPMTGRNGIDVNPDMLISLFCAMGTIIAFGFVAPLINVFRRPNCIIGGLVLTMFIFCMITVSDVGFPYRPKTNVMRVDSMQVHRKFFEYDGSLSLEDSGYYLHLLDRHKEEPLRETMNLTDLKRVGDFCGNELMCGIPCFRWCSGRKEARWLPRQKLVELPYPTVLEFLNKTILENVNQVRYEFKLSGPPNMGLFIKPKDGVRVLRWSFLQAMLDNPVTYKAPLQILMTHGSDRSPVEFYIEFLKNDGNFEEPVFELGVSGHHFSPNDKRDDLSLEFLASLPDFAYSMEWPSSYERYIF